MTNQKKKDHYVYALIDCNDVVRYIGQGRGSRYKSRNRTTKFLEILDNNGKIEILNTDLSKSEALDIEHRLILENKKTIINRNSSSRILTISYSEMNDLFIISDKSPSGLIWKVDRKTRKAFSNAGSIDSSGYYRVETSDKCYKCHRIVWCLYNKMDLDCDLVIDHVDGDKSNNNPANLQAVSILENNIRCRFTSDREPLYSSTKQVYIASIKYQDTVRYKSFSISKYGKENAYKLALEALRDFIEEIRKP